MGKERVSPLVFLGKTDNLPREIKQKTALDAALAELPLLRKERCSCMGARVRELKNDL